MIRPTTGFIVYGVHKDGLQDPMGQPFIDEAIVARAKQRSATRASSWSNTRRSWPPRKKAGRP